MTEHSDIVSAAEQILKETDPVDEVKFDVVLPRKLVRKLSARFEIGMSMGDMVAEDLLTDQKLSDEEREKWQKLVQGRHDDMKAILGKSFGEALGNRSSIGLVKVSLSYREVDYLGRYRKDIIADDFKSTTPDDEMVIKGKMVLGYGSAEEEGTDFLGINMMFVEAGGRDNVELRTFYEGLLGR